MNQLLIDEFRTIYQNNQTQKLLPYLQKLTAKERKELVKELRPYKEVAHQKGNKGIYFATAIACCTQSQFRSYTEWYFISGVVAEQADEILAWYCPDWFPEHYNDDTMWGTMAYSDLLRWQLKGFLKPSRSLIARSISQEARRYNKEISEYEYPTDFLYADPLVLEDHIWALFEETSSIHYHDYAKPQQEGPWTKIFKSNIASGHLDRMRVLRACLLTVNHNIDKINMGWCFDLFVELKPTKEELLALQEELVNTLNKENTKPINKSLDALKQIADDSNFHVENFLNHLTVLLSSEVKSIVQSALMILQKVAKKHASFRETICSEVPLAFLNKDEAIQTRAAKIIIEFGDPNSEVVRTAVGSYQDVLLMSTQTLLKNYLDKEATAEQRAMDPIEAVLPINLYAEENKMQRIETVEDLIFFLSGVFDQEVPVHLDLLPEALIRLNSQITAAHLNQLEIALQKAYSLNIGDPFWHSYDRDTNEFTGTDFWGMSGLYLRMLALFFINYGQYLQKKYPKEGQFIEELHELALQEVNKQTYKKWFSLTYKISRMEQWFGRDFKLLQPYLQVFSQALSFIEKGITLPLLSTPTHAPAWIDPQILNKRLEAYRKANIKPDLMDWQLAVSRCPSIMEKEPVYEALQKHIQTYSWKIGEEKKADSTYSQKPVLEMQIPDSPWQAEHNLYAGIGDNIRYYVAPQDSPYLGMMYPSLPAIPYGLLIRDRFHFAQMENAQTRDMLTASIAALYELKTALDPVTTLFLSCCMLCSEKTIRNYAAEIWMERTTHQLIQQAQLGQTLGFLMSAEWAPVKRFTDMVTGTFLTAGTLYSSALEELFVAILLQIEQPVTNLKKLLEIYNELLALNRSECAAALLPKLEVWGKENTLKKVAKQLLNISSQRDNLKQPGVQ
ncbi:DUF6493 family protein [Bacteroides sp. 224]|uniref:DUF6493 family protein n=1 Tax=Bacteroides sp. 224 TaxID=2302936 RepID=UPI0013D1D3CE|nr:DUF6493 family protein [Bacteroides sp. 224]NDV66158.1 hypothetical protein [Bacteroides sp. 224]